MRYEANVDGTLSNGELFFDVSNAPGVDSLSGIKVDQQGNLYVAGPGGVWILSAEARCLGTILTGKKPYNLAWGDADGKTLYLTARDGLYCVRLGVPGIRPEGNQP